MITGVSIGFSTQLEMVGVGYKAEILENKEELDSLILKLGFSHPVKLAIPRNIKISVIKTNKSDLVVVSGIDNETVNSFASKIRDYRRPEPYKGKGLIYLNEQIRRKEGKKEIKKMVNYYKPRYKKWLRNGKLIFSEKESKFEKFRKKKWQSFKTRNKNPSLQSVITFEERLRLESERGLYKKSLIQKQILRSFYGNLSEKQFKALILRSDLFNTKSKLSFISLLESRLDVFLYRAHLASTLNEAKQAISHKKITVNGINVRSKSYLLSPGDLVQMNVSRFDQTSYLNNETSGFKVKDSLFRKCFQDIFKLILKQGLQFF